MKLVKQQIGRTDVRPRSRSACMTTLLMDLVFVVIIITSLGRLYQNTPYRWLAYYASGDPRLALVVSQAILDHGSIRLDEYEADLPGARFFSHNGHLYDYFPLGSSLIALPAVAGARHLGHDMRDMTANFHVQFLLALATSLLIASGLYILARNRLTPFAAFLLTTYFFFGTPLVTALMTAYWSHNAALLCAVAALILSLYSENRFLKNHGVTVDLSIGFLAGLAYISRPTMALFCILMPAWALRNGWRRAVTVSAGLALSIGGLMLYSLVEYNQLLPPYYAGGRLGGAETFLVAVAGNLISPSRGILIHAPLVGIIVLAGLWRLYRQSLSALGIGCLMWYALHLAGVSLFPHWWAGWSYGARIQADVMPALFLLAVVLLPCRIDMLRVKGFLVALPLCVLMAWGIWVHTYQGVLNSTTAKWSKVPDIDQYPHLLWSWKYPQFLASQEQIDNRLDYLAETHPDFQNDNRDELH